MDTLGDTNLHWSDILVISLYFVFVLGVGIWSSRSKGKDSMSGYFLAGRSMTWFPVGASLFSSNIGSGHFIGLAGSGAASGIGIAGFELNALFIMLILGWVFLPVYISAGVYTMPEYLRKRFGGQRIRVYLSVLALLLYIFTKISADLFAGAIFLELAMGWNLYISVVALLAISALFTIAGGLTAVIYTDTLQTIIMIIGSMVLTILSFEKVGGYDSMLEKYFKAIPNVTIENTTCGYPPKDALHLLRDPINSDLPWPGLIFGLTVSAVWYWCSDQVIVQRALAAKDLSHAKIGCVMCGALKVLPLFLLVFPGMIARILFADKIACATPESCQAACGTQSGCTNIAYPLLVLNVMPIGARGLMLSVMVAALMSSLTSIFNSASTLFTIDIWQRIRKSAGDIELLLVSRVFTLVLVAVSIAWIPIIQNSHDSQLFNYIQSITSYLSPPVCAVYVLAILWDRVNEKGAFYTLLIGLVIGLIRFGMDIGMSSPPCGQEDTRPAILAKVHYLYFGIILFFISCIVCIVVSCMTEPIAKDYLWRLTFWTRHSTEERRQLSIAEGNTNEASEQTAPYTIEENTSNNYKKENIHADEEPPRWRRYLNFLCGVSSEPAPAVSQEDLLAQELRMTSIKEEPHMKTITNILAVLLMTCGGFLWGFYA